MIPETVITMEYAFFWIDIEKAPRIPASVKNLESTFDCNTSLQGTIIIDAKPDLYTRCFYGIDMSKIAIEGNASQETKKAIANTGENANDVKIK